MKRGKYICGQLKAIRRTIAKENNIPLEIPECTYEGECRGTCPRCEAEVQYLENELARRAKLGITATVAGVAMSLTACGGGDSVMPIPNADTTPLPIADTTTPTMTDTLAPKPNFDFPIVGGIMVLPLDSIPTETKEKLSTPEPLIEGEVDDTDELAGVIIEDNPEFPGGYEAMCEYIKTHLTYPQTAIDYKVEGKVYIQCFVETDGSLTNIRCLRDIGHGCGEAAIEVVKGMPKWKPGRQKGTVVRMQYTIPISFKLDE